MSILTGKTARAIANRTKDWWLHIVDPADTTDNAAGSSFKATIETIQGYKEYIATISQAGTAAPVPTIIKNELSAAPVFAYVSTGVYTITLTGEFTVGKTAVFLTGSLLNAWFTYSLTSVNVITIRTTLTTGPANSSLDGASIRILVKP
jgi:hypothetical protein